jgi:hypothetical protein
MTDRLLFLEHFTMIFYSLFITTIILLISYADGTNNCVNPLPRSCAFYKECLETKYQCGPEGYPIGFGQKFCQVFEREVDKFSPQGQEFLWTNMQCLQNRLVLPYVLINTRDCSNLKQSALDSHAPCYIKSGFCDLPFTDKLVLTKLLLENDITDIWWDFTLQVADVLKNCYFPSMLGTRNELLFSPSFTWQK